MIKTQFIVGILKIIVYIIFIKKSLKFSECILNAQIMCICGYLLKWCPLSQIHLFLTVLEHFSFVKSITSSEIFLFEN